ncbi:MAG: SDR family oxidoreductase [Leptospiraceae bacterium]|nr:SDR family oxidoreductase [Leptospiraceae bacterium]MCP5494634.1 SDR family oxidoreductase [Leptospiraceae bacterium]
MKDKVVLIMGGTAGLGKIMALKFHSLDSKVIITGRRENEGKQISSTPLLPGNPIHFIKCDVSNAVNVKQVLDEVIKKYGRLDVAINNAGILGKSCKIVDCPEEDWDKIANINLKGTFLCMKYEIEKMIPKGGVILNISSISGINGYPYNSPYAATKHGVNGLTKSAALEFGDKNIRINSICPGAILTEMLEELFVSTGQPELAKNNVIKHHPINRLSTPEEVADTCIWLCSPEASFINGAVIPVDGGWSSK